MINRHSHLSAIIHAGPMVADNRGFTAYGKLAITLLDESTELQNVQIISVLPIANLRVVVDIELKLELNPPNLYR